MSEAVPSLTVFLALNWKQPGWSTRESCGLYAVLEKMGEKCAPWLMT